MTSSTPSPRVRREPPPFRRVEVGAVTPLSSRMVRVRLHGAELEGLTIPEPAASVRLLIPSGIGDDLEMPTWNGNEFLLGDGSRPVIRTFTPRRLDSAALELDLDVVIHSGGAVSTWIEAADVGSPAAVSGPGRGYTVDSDAAGFVLAGDETAIPAIAQLLEVIPASRPIQVIIEVADPSARLDLTLPDGSAVEWVDLDPAAPPGDALVPALTQLEIAPGAKLWVAGEAAAMHRVRRHLFDDRALPRSDVTVRGYWKLRESVGSDS